MSTRVTEGGLSLAYTSYDRNNKEDRSEQDTHLLQLLTVLFDGY